jgi:hypothetical protein
LLERNLHVNHARVGEDGLHLVKPHERKSTMIDADKWISKLQLVRSFDDAKLAAYRDHV